MNHKLLVGWSAYLVLGFFGALSALAQDVEEPEAPPRIAVVDGNPYLMVTIVDVSSDMDARRAPLRERLLKDAFEDAIKQSRLRYAYSVGFRSRKREEFVPELILEIRNWKHVGSGAFECTVDAKFVDASGEHHDLKGAIGIESTLSMSQAPVDVEDHLQASARKAFSTILRRILKKGLYVAP